MFQHFELLPFLVGIVVGVVGLLFFKPSPPVIVQYPHPKNVEKLVFRDPNQMCYKYTMKEVNCDANEGSLKQYPLQNGLPQTD